MTLAGGDALPNGLEPRGARLPAVLGADLRDGAHLDYDLLSTIAYFGVPATSTRRPVRRPAPRWTAWNSATMTNVINAAHAEGVKVVLTVTMMAWDDDYAPMSALLNNSTRRTQLAAADRRDAIDRPQRRRRQPRLRADAERAADRLHRSSSVTCAPRSGRARTSRVATTGGAATWDEGYDLAGITAPGAADAIMVMGYDFNWSGSARAGGVVTDRQPVRARRPDRHGELPRQGPGEQAHLGRAVLRPGVDDDRLHRQRAARAGGDRQLHRGAAGRSATTTRSTARAAKGRRWDAVGPGAVVHVQEPDLRRAGPGLLRRRGLARRQARPDHRQRAARRGHLAPAHGRRARASCGTQLWRQLLATCRSATSTTRLPRAHHRVVAERASPPAAATSASARWRASPVREMAGFLARALDLPGGSVDRFSDDDGIRSRAEHQPDRRGRDHDRMHVEPVLSRPRRDPRADGELPRSRARPARRRASTHFTDDEGSTHENAINRLAAAGIADGCASNRYCPSSPVSREQMAAFLHRALAP